MVYRETVRVRERKAAQRQALVSAAEKLVRSHGFAGLTVQSLAREAGVAIGTVYRHFEAKDTLAVEVFTTASSREVAAVAEAVRQPGDMLARIEQAVAVFAWRAMKAPRLAWALIAEPVDPAVDAARIEYRQAYADVFHGVLAEGVASGQLPEQDCALSAAALVGALAEALLGPLAQHEAPDQVIAQLQAFCVRAIGAGR